jgi:hypothetical protein
VQSHRFRDQLDRVSFPASAPAPLSVNGFMPCPVAVLCQVSPVQWLWQQQIYQLALEQAQAVARPSWLERDVLGVRN